MEEGTDATERDPAGTRHAHDGRGPEDRSRKSSHPSLRASASAAGASERSGGQMARDKSGEVVKWDVVTAERAKE